METKNYTVTAFGKNKLETLSRITTLYLQRHIPVESFSMEKMADGNGKFEISAKASESSIERIVKQIKSIVDITRVECN